jgi:methyl-accepting chemotaxis protein
MMDTGKSSYLNKILSKRSIKNQVWFGFGLMLTILIVMSLSTLNVFTQLNQGINEVTEKIQPVFITTQNLELALEATNSSLGYYLLTREDAYKDSYIDQLNRAKELTSQLVDYEVVSDHQNYNNIIELVEEDLIELETYKDQMIELANNDLKNMPAQQIASEKLNPMAQTLQSMISQMIISDYDEENIDGERDEYRQTIYDLRYYNVQIASELRTFLAFRSNSNIQNLNAIREVVLAKLEAISEAEYLYTFEQSDLIPELLLTNQAYYLALDEAIAIHSSDRYRRDIYLVNNEIRPLVTEIQSELGALTNQLNELISSTSKNLQETASSAIEKVIIGLISGLLVGIIIAIFMTRMMSIPINAAVRAMEDLADGEGDLTQRLAGTGNSDIAKMAKGFNGFASKVQTLVSQVAGSVGNLSSVVGQVTVIVDQTQGGSKQQHQQTEHVVKAIAEMTSSVQDVASNANSAADSAHRADEKARSGQKVVGETIASINLLASEIETGVNVVNKLSKDVESIGSVLGVIKSIADQTNLLALNAAIEAARAGEQGRGFSVVADEVRTLASRTQESTRLIEEMIDNLQKQVLAAVEAISNGQEKAKSSVETASNAGEALEEIATSVATISDMIIQIASASEEQGAVASEINQNVINISHIADENASASDKLANSSDDLAQLASELKQQVSNFKY